MPFCLLLFFSYNTYTHVWDKAKHREVCRSFLHGTHMVVASHPRERKHRFAVVALSIWSFQDFPRKRAGSASLFFPPIMEGMTILNVKLFTWGTQFHERKGNFNKGAVNQKGK